MLSKSSNHVSEEHITLKRKSKDDKNNLNFSKFFLILQIFKWTTENQSVIELLRKLWNRFGNKYVVSKFLILFLRYSVGCYQYHPVNCISTIQSLEIHIQPYYLHLRSFFSSRASRKEKKKNCDILQQLVCNSLRQSSPLGDVPRTSARAIFLIPLSLYKTLQK